jgi:uncharacterized protein YndB with AHSA1/START domain
MESIKELKIVRIIDAPRELVFKAWTEPKRFAMWWMPKGFTIPVCEIDARPGGKMRILAEHKDFPNHWMTGVILELVEPELLVFTSQAFADDNGNAKLEVRNTIKFEEENGKTKLTLNAIVTKADPEMSAALAGMDEGWKQTLDKLDAYILNNIDQK